MKILIAWVVLSGVAAAVAKKSGRNPLLWGSISILLSPFIVIPLLAAIHFFGRKNLSGFENKIHDSPNSKDGDVSDSEVQGNEVFEIRDGVYRLNLKKLSDVDDLATYKKDVQLALKGLRQALKENNQEMASIRAGSSLNRARGTRGGIGTLFNSLNTMARDSKIGPRQELKERMQELVQKIENHLIDIDQKINNHD